MLACESFVIHENFFCSKRIILLRTDNFLQKLLFLFQPFAVENIRMVTAVKEPPG